MGHDAAKFASHWTFLITCDRLPDLTMGVFLDVFALHKWALLQMACIWYGKPAINITGIINKYFQKVIYNILILTIFKILAYTFEIIYFSTDLQKCSLIRPNAKNITCGQEKVLAYQLGILGCLPTERSRVQISADAIVQDAIDAI